MRSFASLRTTSHPDDLARVHDVLRIECALDRAHGVELDAAAVVGEFVDLELSDAVLGRDRAAIGHDDIVDGPADGLAVRHEALLVPARRRLTVEVNIAVTDMAERYRPALRQRLLHRLKSLLHEGGDLAHRHRDVMLDRRALALLRL